MPGTRILIVEDEPDLALGLRVNLEAEGHAVELAHDGQIGLERARAGRFDLVLLDVMLPRLDGLAVLAKLRAEGVASAIILLTAKGSDEDVVRGLSLGADDYVAKPFALAPLLARCNAVLRRTRGVAGPGPAPEPEAEERFSVGEAEVDLGAYEVRRSGEVHGLSVYEAAVLRQLQRRRGQVVSRDEILDAVWGQEHYPTERVVDNVVLRLRKKLEKRAERPEHLLTVHGVGYKLVAP